MVKREYKASTVVEMTYLMPVVLLVWVLVVFTLFYYHDKSILAGAAYETAIVASEYCQREVEMEVQEFEGYFEERINGKLLFFPYAVAEVELDEKKATVIAQAYSRRFRVEIQESAAIIEAEKHLRKMEMIKENLEDIGD